ncbi:DUF5808 domain-containing protein [Acetobacterium bakii]|uniref:DUF5808 domain-containing protein n=1 Tax=Acetobacterium bakii TaxID=52689 RepID=A0A0L6TWZ2_9FIRM|nr:DUF5808 domain-containing protein [Acetobacterium bakii]KNZ40592.1 hypothetical protein AKG39_16720 [Acetobacterium bakii]
MDKRKWTKQEIDTYRENNSTFYYLNPEDSNFLVPKPYGLGWTVNWANPKTWFFVFLITSFYVARFFYRRQKKSKNT